jgi:hypothetical protein
MNVRTAAGRHPGQQTPQGTIGASSVLQATAHTGTMETCNLLVWFNLCVDNFGIKYIEREHLQHLYDALRKETRKHMKLWKIGWATYIAGLH